MEDAGASLSSVAATVSLLVLIVVELTSFVRDEIGSPGEIVATSTVFGLGKVDWWPSLGRLVVVHSLSVAVLAVATFLVFSVSGQPVSVALLIIVLLIALLLPMLEVGEYEAIGETGFPLSLVYNGLAVIVFTVLGVLWSSGPIQSFSPSLNGLVNFLTSPLSVPSKQSFGVVVILLSGVIFAFATLVQLEHELERAAESDSTTDPANDCWYP